MVDTNIIIDAHANREPYADDAKRFMEKCAAREITGILAAHSIPNLFYILRKNFSQEERRFLLKNLCDRYQVPLIINDRPDLAKKSGASGVHVGLSDMGIQKARNLLGEDFIIGGSAHNVEEALAAEAAGADYLGCGAVFGSTTKTNVTQLPVETLKAIC